MNSGGKLSSEQWNEQVVALLSEPLRRVGMGEPGVGPFYVTWHASAGSEHRPCPDSPIWQASGSACYDVVVRLAQTDDQRERLLAFTEGTGMLDVDAPTSIDDLASTVQPLAASIEQIITSDFARFERENNGFLPGAEPLE